MRRELLWKGDRIENNGVRKSFGTWGGASKSSWSLTILILIMLPYAAEGSRRPTRYPSAYPTSYPTDYPTAYPTSQPTSSPQITTSPSAFYPTVAPSATSAARLITVWMRATFPSFTYCTETEENKQQFLSSVREAVATEFSGGDTGSVSVVSTECGSTVITLTAQSINETKAGISMSMLNNDPSSLFSTNNSFNTSLFGPPAAIQSQIVTQAPTTSPNIGLIFSGRASDESDAGTIAGATIGSIIGAAGLGFGLWMLYKYIHGKGFLKRKQRGDGRRFQDHTLDFKARTESEEEIDGTAVFGANSTTRTPPRSPRGLNLPPGWKRYHHEETGRPYYFNKDTGVSQWDPPASPPNPTLSPSTVLQTKNIQVILPGSGTGNDDAKKGQTDTEKPPKLPGETLDLPPGWEAHVCQGKVFYHNESTGISRWTPPTGAAVDLTMKRLFKG